MKKLSEYKRLNDRMLLLDGQPGLLTAEKCLISSAPPVNLPNGALSSSF